MDSIDVANYVVAEEVDDKNNSNVLRSMKRTSHDISLECSEISSVEAKRTKHEHNSLVLPTMPRCSSFENLSTVWPSPKKSKNHRVYKLWKRRFEQPQPKPAEVMQEHLARMRQRVHNMSSAVSGHLTPKGFPFFTRIFNRRSQLKKRKIRAMCVEEKEEQRQRVCPAYFQLDDEESLCDNNFPAAINFPTANIFSELSASKQAIIIKQLHRKMKETILHLKMEMERFLS